MDLSPGYVSTRLVSVVQRDLRFLRRIRLVYFKMILDLRPTNTVDTLKSLEFTAFPIIDASPRTSLTKFRNLVNLCVHTVCSGSNCGFSSRLTDDDVGDLATTTFNLKYLRLGRPCAVQIGRNPVISLMLLSIHCPDIEVLETHFETQKLAHDMQRLLDSRDGYGKPKCKVWDVFWGKLGSGLIDDQVDACREGQVSISIVVKGFKLIFPGLRTLQQDSEAQPYLCKSVGCT
jgi:hypothetical protein